MRLLLISILSVPCPQLLVDHRSAPQPELQLQALPQLRGSQQVSKRASRRIRQNKTDLEMGAYAN